VTTAFDAVEEDIVNIYTYYVLSLIVIEGKAIRVRQDNNGDKTTSDRSHAFLPFSGRQEWYWNEAPLHRAAAIGRAEILRLLVDGGASLRSYSIHDNDDKLTCLHLAGITSQTLIEITNLYLVWCNQPETVRALLKMGADPNQTGTWLDYAGTAWDFAMQNKNAAVLEAFREHDKDGQFAAAGNFAGPNSLKQTARLGEDGEPLSGVEASTQTDPVRIVVLRRPQSSQSTLSILFPCIFKQPQD